MDNSSIHPASQHLSHLIDLFLFKGAPENLDPDNEVQILVNHGYVVGFCPQRLQPLWSAYRVALASQDVDYDRPHLYYADNRLDKGVRLDASTFGREDGIAYHVGHMVPNEVINRQFGRLAQLETFFMSNMCPQRGSLNSGAWLRLEDKIRNIVDMPKQADHVWAIAGPYFGEVPDLIDRVDGKSVPIPEGFYCILVDPFRYPWDRPSNVDVACFMLPQAAERRTPLEDLLVEQEEVERRTKLKFFGGWQQVIGEELVGEDGEDAWTRHRLLRQL